MDGVERLERSRLRLEARRFRQDPGYSQVASLSGRGRCHGSGSLRRHLRGPSENLASPCRQRAICGSQTTSQLNSHGHTQRMGDDRRPWLRLQPDTCPNSAPASAGLLAKARFFGRAPRAFPKLPCEPAIQPALIDLQEILEVPDLRQRSLVAFRETRPQRVASDTKSDRIARAL